MLRRVGTAAVSISLLFSISLPKVFAADPVPCINPISATVGNLCIVEVQTKGVNDEEDQDFVILANLTSLRFAPTNLRLQYVNSNGVYDSGISIGSFDPGQVKIYVNSTLANINPGADNLPMALASSGGSLRIARATSSTNPTPITIYDQLGWGITSLSETAPVAEQSLATTIARRMVGGVAQDTGNNGADFEMSGLACPGAAFNELQPFVTDDAGQSIDAWVELRGTSNSPGDCTLVTATGEIYEIPAVDLPLGGELSVINGALDSNNQPTLPRSWLPTPTVEFALKPVTIRVIFYILYVALKVIHII